MEGARKKKYTFYDFPKNSRLRRPSNKPIDNQNEIHIVDAQFCTHDLIKKNDLNDHPCTLKIMIALRA